jgi:N-succinyl-L-ornithine transcarbamylase
VLGKYFDILGIRTFPSLKNRAEDYSEQHINQFVKYSGVPVVSLESATLHPLQSLADMVTIQETFTEKRKPKIVLTWAPHVKALPQCVANSFSQWITAWGKSDFVITHPEHYELDEAFTKGASVVSNQELALRDADFVYVKNWSTYSDYGQLLSDDPGWMLTPRLLKLTNNARVMNCLPVRRNVELSDEVLNGPNSIVTQQAANRVWAAQSVLSEILRNE